MIFFPFSFYYILLYITDNQACYENGLLLTCSSFFFVFLLQHERHLSLHSKYSAGKCRLQHLHLESSRHLLHSSSFDWTPQLVQWRHMHVAVLLDAPPLQMLQSANVIRRSAHQWWTTIISY